MRDAALAAAAGLVGCHGGQRKDQTGKQQAETCRASCEHCFRSCHGNLNRAAPDQGLVTGFVYETPLLLIQTLEAVSD